MTALLLRCVGLKDSISNCPQITNSISFTNVAFSMEETLHNVNGQVGKVRLGTLASLK